MSLPLEQDEPQKRSRLSAVWDGVKWTASALLPFPFTRKGKGEPDIGKWHISWKKFAVYAAAWWLLQPAATMLFPRAEKTVADAGVSASVVQELAPGKQVYVRHDNLTGKFHAVFDRGIVYAPSVYKNYISNSNLTGAFTRPSVSLAFRNVCAVYLKSEAGEVESRRATAAYVTNASDGKLVYKDLVPLQDLMRLVQLHEIRHCSDANIFLEGQTVKEAEASNSAVEVLARESGNPSLQHAFLMDEAFGFLDGSHDNALYFDAKLRGVPAPSSDEMDAANAAAAPIAQHILASRVTNVCEGDGADECQTDFYVKEYRLSDLAARRLDLFVEAMNEKITPATAPQTAKPAVLRGPGA